MYLSKYVWSEEYPSTWMCIYTYVSVYMLKFYFNFSSEGTKLVWILSKFAIYSFKMNFNAAMLFLTLLLG